MSDILKNKKIILGVTGSIAAYKSPLLARELIKRGAHVNVVMTDAAKRFVTAVTLTNVSKNPVVTELFDESTQNGGAWHIQLAHWADAMIIAPCSAATMGKIASGICDNALTTVALAMPSATPLILSPAMDFTMYLHPSTRRNEALLKEYGALIIPPEEGELASGLSGPGRMPDVSVLVSALEDVLSGKPFNPEAKKKSGAIAEMIARSMIDNTGDLPAVTLGMAVESDRLNAEIELAKMKSGVKFSGKTKGKKVLITAGPTYESIDDVRFIGNRSSGKMGYAIAEVFAMAGAEVVLVSGPVALQAPKGVEIVYARAADEMFTAVADRLHDIDVAIFSAAVADFAPLNRINGKIKKSDIDENMMLELKPTKDILAYAGKIKKPGQIIVGFALESDNELENAKKKLVEKNCDLLILNSAGKPDSGFAGDDNTITVLSKYGQEKAFPTMSKKLCAGKILAEVENIL